MFERAALAVTRISLKYPWRVVAFFAVLIGLGALASTRLELRLNYMELLPRDTPAVVELRAVSKKAGTEGYLVAAISGGTAEQRHAFIPRLAAALETLPVVRYTEHQNDVTFLRQHAGTLMPLRNLEKVASELESRVKRGVEDSMDLGLDDEDDAPVDPKKKEADDRELQRLLDDYHGQLPEPLLEDPERTEQYVLIKPAFASLGLAEVNQLLDSVRAKVDSEIAASGLPLRGSYGGPAVFIKSMNDGSRKDLSVISAVAGIAALTLLLFATRRPLASLFIFLPIAGAITCALGVAALTIGHLNVISSLLVAILLGLGVEFGIHLILRTNEAKSRLPLEEALLEAAPETMAGAFSGAITNGAAFLVLVFASFSAYRQFGFIAAMGILLSWLFTYSLLPAIILLTERARPGWVIREGTGISKSYLPKRGVLWALVVFIPVLALAGAWALPRVGLERSFNALSGKQAPDTVGNRAASAMKTSLTPALIWVDSVASAEKLESIFSELKEKDPDPRGSIIQSTLSLGRALPSDWDRRTPVLHRVEKALRKLPDSVWNEHKADFEDFLISSRNQPLSLEEIPLSMRRKFQSLDGEGTFVFFFASRSVDDAKELDDYVAKLEEALTLARAQGIQAQALSENRIAVHIFRQVFADAPFVAWSATLVSFAVLLLLLRNLKQTLIVFAPLAMGMLLMLLGMYFLKVKLNFINMCVIPSIFTVAIDNTVHLYHRYEKEGRSQMPTILGNTGMAILMATLVNASGYAPMLLASFYGMKSLGIVASLGMLGMLLATVAWFPALLALLPDHQKPAARPE